MQGLSPRGGSGVPAPGHGAGDGWGRGQRGARRGWDAISRGQWGAQRGWDATEATMFRPKHEPNSVGSLKRHRQDTGAGHRSGAQTDGGTRTHGQTKKKMKCQAGGRFVSALCCCPRGRAGPALALPETPAAGDSPPPAGPPPLPARGHQTRHRRRHCGGALPRPSLSQLTPSRLGRGGGQGVTRAARQKGHVPLLIIH